MTISDGRRRMLEHATEAQLDAVVMDMAGLGGWDLAYHTHDARRSPQGFPDRVLVHRRRRLTIFAELKGYDSRGRLGQPTAEQLAWLAGLRDAGQFAYLWAPLDVELIEAVLLRGDVDELPPLPEPSARKARRP